MNFLHKRIEEPKYIYYEGSKMKLRKSFENSRTKEYTALVDGRITLVYPELKNSKGESLIILQPTGKNPISTFKHMKDMNIKEALKYQVKISDMSIYFRSIGVRT